MKNSDGDPPIISIPDLDMWWNELPGVLNERNMLLFPASPTSLRGAVQWPGSRPVTEFLDLAHTLGVRLVYATPGVLNVEMVSELGLDSSAAHTLTGRLAYLDVWWGYQGIRHACTVLAAWYVPLIEQSLERYQACRTKEDENHRMLEEAVPSIAADLARNPAFASAPGGVEGRRRIAQAFHPDFSPDLLRRVVVEAGIIHMNEVVPEQERELSTRAPALLSA